MERVDEITFEKNAFLSAQWSPDGTLAIASGRTLSIAKWNPQSKKYEILASYQNKEWGDNTFSGIHWGPDGMFEVNTFGKKGYVFQYDASSKKIKFVDSLQLPGEVPLVSWGPEGTLLVEAEKGIKLLGFELPWLSKLKQLVNLK
jgi:WD40 repeat protein